MTIERDVVKFWLARALDLADAGKLLMAHHALTIAARVAALETPPSHAVLMTIKMAQADLLARHCALPRLG
jgi:hypothetical protein